MAFQRPTLQQIIDRISNDFVAKITGATTLAMRSVLQVMARVYAAACHLIYGYLDNMAKQLYATTATGVYLDIIGSEIDINRKMAEAAIGTVTFSGTVSTIIPQGTALRSPTGIRYLTDSQVTIESTGTVTSGVTCDTPGETGNDVIGVVLTIDSPISGVNSTAPVTSIGGLYNGREDETDADYRARILIRKRYAPSGGTSLDLVNWTKEVSFATRAWVVERYNGMGTAALYFVCDNQNPITPTTEQIAEVSSYLEAHIDANGMIVGIPVTMKPGLLIASPTLVALNFIIHVSPNTQAVKDSVREELTDLIAREAYPGATFHLSSVNEAISAATGEDYHMLYYPSTDLVMEYNQVGIIGSITWA